MQTRAGALFESIVNTLIGYGVALATQLAVFPLFGLRVSLGDNILIGLIFTVVSIGRSYVLRRFFEWWWHGRG